MTRLLTRFTRVPVLILVLTLAGSFGFFAILLLLRLGLAALGFGGRVFDSSAKGMGEASTLAFRMTRLRTRFTLAAVLVFARAASVGFFVVLLLARLGWARLGLRRRVFGLLRVTWRTARPADFTAFPERGFFVFMPCCYPFGGYRILSDARYITAAAGKVQREIGAEKAGNLVCGPAQHRQVAR